MTITTEQQNEIVRLAAANAQDMSNAEIGSLYGVSSERIRQIIASHGIVKARKLGREHECQKPGCRRRFRGVKDYAGHKAVYCHKHRRVKK